MKKTNKLTEAILETANDMFESGILSKKEHGKITKRHLKKNKFPKIDAMSSKEIKTLREEANLSQAVVANCFNLTVGYISQLERGTKKPTGAVLALLNVIRRKGFNVVLQ